MSVSIETDDLNAVRVLVDTLSPFDRPDQERIIRWACEKLGFAFTNKIVGVEPSQGNQSIDSLSLPGGGGRDIRSFVSEKNPASDNQLAAVVAYYYRFEAPAHQRKEAITGEDLQEACRLSGRDRLRDPGKTLGNAHGVGWLDKAGQRGAYSINTVGENLVAMTLPDGGIQSSTTIRRKVAKGSTRNGNVKKKKK